ncbi:MAG: Fe-S protein assembly co-chaperone HscB [Gallionella sp.]
MPTFNAQKNHFELFALPASYEMDVSQLEQAFRIMQAQVHPDKSAHLSEQEQRLAMQRSILVNEAYQTVRSPIRRGRYLLSLQGVDTEEETNTAMPVSFLVEQMERREALADAVQTDKVSEVEQIEARMKRDTRELEVQLAVKIDTEHNYTAAAQLVRKLRFMEKLAEEIDSAYDNIDG